MDVYAKLEELLSHVTYKPGWTINLQRERVSSSIYQPRDPYQFYIVVAWKMFDVANPDKEITLHFKELVHFLPCEDVKEKDLIELVIFRAIYHAEQHEMHEWFKFDGFCVYDPHPEYKALR